MSTPIQDLYIFLQSSGMFSTWTGPDGSSQESPTVQMRILEEANVPSNERILLIKQVSPGGGSRFASTPVFTFVVLGKVGEPPVYAETYANLVYEELLKFISTDCIVGIDPMGAVNGAYKMESGRHAYDMEFMATIGNL